MKGRTLDLERDYEPLRARAQQRFVRVLRRWGQHHHHDLDELSQDLYQEAWLALGKREDPPVVERDEAGYLAGVMVNLFLTRERRKRLPTTELDGAVSEAVAAMRTTHDESVAEFDLSLAHEVIATLPERERAAFVMRWLFDLGHEQIASVLGVSHRTARLLVEKAGRRIAPAIEQVEAGTWCDQYQSTLAAIREGWPVDPARRAALEEHVQACAVCRATVGRMRGLAAITPLPVMLIGASGSALTLKALLLGRPRAGATATVLKPAGAAGAGSSLAAKAAVIVAAGVVAGGTTIAVRDAREAERPASTAATVSAAGAGTPVAAPPTATARATPAVKRTVKRPRKKPRAASAAPAKTASAPVAQPTPTPAPRPTPKPPATKAAPSSAPEFAFER